MKGQGPNPHIPTVYTYAVPHLADLKHWSPNRPKRTVVVKFRPHKRAIEGKPENVGLGPWVSEAMNDWLNMRIPHPLPHIFTVSRFMLDMSKWLTIFRIRHKGAKLYYGGSLSNKRWVRGIDITALERIKVSLNFTTTYGTIMNVCSFVKTLVNLGVMCPGDLPKYWDSPPNPVRPLPGGGHTTISWDRVPLDVIFKRSTSMLLAPLEPSTEEDMMKQLLRRI